MSAIFHTLLAKAWARWLAGRELGHGHEYGDRRKGEELRGVGADGGDEVRGVGFDGGFEAEVGLALACV